MIFINLFCIAVIVVFIVDLSGVTEHLLSLLSKYIGRPVADFRPFTCSLCMTWWAGLVYLMVRGSLDIPSVAILSLLALATRPLSGLLQKIIDALTKLF